MYRNKIKMKNNNNKIINYNITIIKKNIFFFSLSRLHDHTNLGTPHSVGLLWTSDQPHAEDST
jgi:hypothetical protein